MWTLLSVVFCRYSLCTYTQWVCTVSKYDMCLYSLRNRRDLFLSSVHTMFCATYFLNFLLMYVTNICRTNSTKQRVNVQLLLISHLPNICESPFFRSAIVIDASTLYISSTNIYLYFSNMYSWYKCIVLSRKIYNVLIL